MKIVRGSFLSGSAVCYRKLGPFLQKGLEFPNGERVWFKGWDVADFYEGKAIVDNGSKYGYINHIGEVIIPFEFIAAESFCEGFAFVIKNNYSSLINTYGNTIMDFDTHLIANYFSEGYSKIAIFADDDFCKKKEALVNTQGEIVIPFEFESETNSPFELMDEEDLFSCGLIRMQKGKKFGFIDSSGNEIVPFVYEWASRFDNGYAAVKYCNKATFINKNGDFIFDPIFDDAAFSFHRVFVLKKNGFWGILDSQGNVVIDFFMNSISRPNNGMMSICLDGKWNMFELDGNFATDFEFDFPPFYKDGLIKYLLNGRAGIMDLDGNCLHSEVNLTHEKIFRLN